VKPQLIASAVEIDADVARAVDEDAVAIHQAVDAPTNTSYWSRISASARASRPGRSRASRRCGRTNT
jgi:hypothetical protein